MKYNTKKKIKGLFKSKTILLSALLSLLIPILSAFPSLKSTLANNYDLCLFILSATIGILRHYTTKPLEDK